MHWMTRNKHIETRVYRKTRVINSYMKEYSWLKQIRNVSIIAKSGSPLRAVKYRARYRTMRRVREIEALLMYRMHRTKKGRVNQ